MTEVWRKVPGFAGYEASNLGRIKSLSRIVNNNGGTRRIPERILLQWTVKSTGYLQVNLSGKRMSGHRVIALSWCDGFFDGAHVDHINGNRSDNRAENLEWVTVSENAKRSFNNGRTNPFLGKRSREHPTAKPVISRCLNTGAVTHWDSAMDAVRDGFDSSSISRCCSGQSKTHKGHEWQYARHGVQWSEPNPYEARQ